ncbi:MAG: hypothetical protein ABSD75_14395 [Terriglobales bacterium]
MNAHNVIVVSSAVATNLVAQIGLEKAFLVGDPMATPSKGERVL